jgi:hypothetical protein
MINGADLYLNGQPVTELVIPAEIECIPQKAFSGCSSIRKVTIPQWVLSIDGEAFRNCANLEIVIFESEPERISYNAFAGCDKLKNFPYPTEDRPLQGWYDPDQYKDVEEKPAMFSQGPARTMLISNWSNFFFKFLVASGCYLLATRRKRY